MHKRIVIFVACALFSLLAMLAVMITDINDRDFPKSIGAENSLGLDFSESGLSIDEGFDILTKFDERWNIGLVKEAPDLSSNNDKKVFITLNNDDSPNKFTWFNGDDEGEIYGKDRLENFYPDGSYLVTGETKYLDDLKQKLKSSGVKVHSEKDSIFDSLKFVVYERGFAAAVLASLALIVTLALFWLSIKAHSRALRVLGGSPTTRIQIQDLLGFIGALLASAVIVTLGAAVYVGIFHGWVYIGTYLRILISLEIAVLAVSLIASLIMSTFAWPSATVIATRQPAVKSLRSAAIIIQSITFILVVAAAGPAWSTFKHSSDRAAEMEQWKQLSNQVSIEFATDIDEMEDVEPQIGKLIKDADSHDKSALSYTFLEEMDQGDDYGKYSAVSFVNMKWLELMIKDKQKSKSFFESVSHQNIPDDIIDLIQTNTELWERGGGDSKKTYDELQFYQPVDGFQMPVSQGGNGEQLYFSDDTLLVIVPSIYDVFNDSNLTSLISLKNIIFDGVDSTQELLEQHDLDASELHKQGIRGELNIVYVAEEGMLQAQYLSYIAWLQNISLITLIIAFSVAVAISALIASRLHAKHDFPLRLAGHSWISIIQVRVTREILVGLVLAGVVYLLQNPEDIEPILVVIVYGLFIEPIFHTFAVRWCFKKVIKRQF